MNQESGGGDERFSFDLDKIRRECKVDQVHFLSEVESTNDWAIRETAQAHPDALEHTALFLAERQTDGRGRGNNRWFSGPGSLTFSLRMPARKPEWGSLEQFLMFLPLAVGCGICDSTVAAQCSSAKAVVGGGGIKWPNDVYANGKKMAGVLSESVASQCIMGCGVNVNNQVEVVSDQIKKLHNDRPRSVAPISLAEFIDRPVSLTDTTVAVVNAVVKRFFECQFAVDGILATVNKFDCLLARKIEWTQGGQSKIGRACGIAEDGGLKILWRDRKGPRRVLETVYSGNIRPLSKNEIDDLPDSGE